MVTAFSSVNVAERPSSTSMPSELPKYGPATFDQDSGSGGTLSQRPSVLVTASSPRLQPILKTTRWLSGTVWCTGDCTSWYTLLSVGSGQRASATYWWCTSPDSTHTVAGGRSPAPPRA